jgi:hypothetical protein
VLKTWYTTGGIYCLCFKGSPLRKNNVLTWYRVFSFMLFAFEGNVCVRTCVHVWFKLPAHGLPSKNNKIGDIVNCSESVVNDLRSSSTVTPFCSCMTLRRGVIGSHHFEWNFFSMTQQPVIGQDFLIIEASRSYSDAPHSVGLLWASDQPDVETSTWQHTTLTRYRHPCCWRISNPQSQQANSRRHAFDRAGTGFDFEGTYYPHIQRSVSPGLRLVCLDFFYL